jgi:hypothetical protein
MAEAQPTKRTDKRESPPANEPEKPPRGQHPESRKHWFKPGNNANPTGRPVRHLDELKKLTNNGQDVVKLLWDVASGSIRVDRQRMDAITHIFNRLYGKLPDTLVTGELDGAAKTAVAELSKENLEALVSGLTNSSAETPPVTPETQKPPVEP